MVEREIYSISRLRSDIIPHHSYIQMGQASERLKYLFDSNVERELGFEGFSLGQVIHLNVFLREETLKNKENCKKNKKIMFM